MEIIQLQDKQEGWRIHRFSTLQQRDTELTRHGISLGKNVVIEPYVMIGDHTVLGDNVRLAEESVVSHHCEIGNNTTLEQGAFVSMRSHIGSDCTLSPDSFVGVASTLGSGVILGKRSEVGDAAKIGNAVHIGKCSYIMEETAIDDGTKIGSGVFIGKRSKAGFFVMIGDDAQLVRDVVIQDGAHIAQGKRIPAFSNVSRKDVQLETDRMQVAINKMKDSLKYDQLATFVSLEGIRCIRAQIDGIWLPSARVDNNDSTMFRQGEISLKQMADKYIAPGYIMQSIDAENRSAGIRR